MSQAGSAHGYNLRKQAPKGAVASRSVVSTSSSAPPRTRRAVPAAIANNVAPSSHGLAVPYYTYWHALSTVAASLAIANALEAAIEYWLYGETPKSPFIRILATIVFAVIAMLEEPQSSKHGPAVSSPNLCFSYKLHPSPGIGLFSVLRSNTLRYLISKSQQDEHFTLRPLTEDQCLKNADLMACLAHTKGVKIRGVTVIEKSFQTHNVQATLERYKKQDGQHPNPVWAWHGTSLENIQRILSHGFAVTPTGGRSYGHGIYFATEKNFYTSQGYARCGKDGHSHVLPCQVYARNLESSMSLGGAQFQGRNPRAEGKKNGGMIVTWQQRVNLTVLPRFIVSI